MQKKITIIIKQASNVLKFELREDGSKSRNKECIRVRVRVSGLRYWRMKGGYACE